MDFFLFLSLSPLLDPSNPSVSLNNYVPCAATLFLAMRYTAVDCTEMRADGNYRRHFITINIQLGRYKRIRTHIVTIHGWDTMLLCVCVCVRLSAPIKNELM